ncbi:MAG TPA: cupredoxin domain-containing protein [Actinomycetota bacterium]|nr:cupredoxin domain-containing protein [Actinomycetota bacterium]
MYQWWVYLHLLGVFGFLLAHGVSTAVAFRLRKERDPARVQALLGMSSASLTGFYPAFGALLLGGIGATTAGDLWGYGWIWWSIFLLLAITGAMYSVARPYYRKLRFVTEALVNGSEAVSPDQYAEALASRRQIVIAAIGLAGLAAILYLMLFKPSLGMAPDAGSPASATAPADATVAASELEFDRNTLSVPAGREFTIAFNNRSSTPHNVSISRTGEDPLFAGEIFSGPRTVYYRVPPLEAGTYDFICDVHPQQMTGTLHAG